MTGRPLASLEEAKRMQAVQNHELKEAVGDLKEAKTLLDD